MPVGGLFQAHAVRIEGHRRRPVGENPKDADLRQRVQRDQDVTIVMEGVQRCLVVERRAIGALGRLVLEHVLRLPGAGDYLVAIEHRRAARDKGRTDLRI